MKRQSPLRSRRTLAWAGAALLGSIAIVTTAATPSSSQPLEDQPAIVAGKGIAEVQTDKGMVQGFVRHGVQTFRGIPYAQAERFLPPQPAAAWEGLRPTLSYGYVCPQPDPQMREPQAFFSDWRFWPKSEDCLNLNVWSPKLGESAKKPVMVWLHGGGFFSGSSMELPVYDGTRLAANGDVVVVSVNHRLNVLGYLDLSAHGEQYASSGNVGMIDIVAALEWVQDNIARFGGDPDNVTIFGQSGGGAKVSTLLAAPSAKGLFHKAIVQSGAPGGMIRPAGESAVAQRVAELVFQFADLENGDIEDLQQLPYDQLIAAADQALAAVSEEIGAGMSVIGRPTVMWAPVVDGEFLPESPFQKKAPAVSKGIPLLVGSTLSEFAGLNPRLAQRQDWGEQEVRNYLQQTFGERAPAIYDAYAKAYPELQPKDWLVTDTDFRGAVVHTATLKAQQGDPVYTYLFALRSPLMDYGWAAGHSAELAFTFDNAELGEQASGGGLAAAKLTEEMSRAWVNFAHTGNPNHDGIPEWPTFMAKRPAVMVFDEEPDVRIGHDQRLLDLMKQR